MLQNINCTLSLLDYVSGLFDCYLIKIDFFLGCVRAAPINVNIYKNTHVRIQKKKFKKGRDVQGMIIIVFVSRGFNFRFNKFEFFPGGFGPPFLPRPLSLDPRIILILILLLFYFFIFHFLSKMIRKHGGTVPGLWVNYIRNKQSQHRITRGISQHPRIHVTIRSFPTSQRRRTAEHLIVVVHLRLDPRWQASSIISNVICRLLNDCSVKFLSLVYTRKETICESNRLKVVYQFDIRRP